MSDLLGLVINDYEILVLYFVVFSLFFFFVCLEEAGESLLSEREERSN